MNPALIVLFIIFFMIILVSRQKQKYIIAQFQRKKFDKGDRGKLLELAKNFIDKNCLIYTFNGSQIDGIIKEVSKSALLVESGNTMEAVNLDFVVRIREYPHKKNGKKKSVVID